MQVPQTPQQSTSPSFPVPRSTARDQGTAKRRRETIKEPFAFRTGVETSLSNHQRDLSPRLCCSQDITRRSSHVRYNLHRSSRTAYDRGSRPEVAHLRSQVAASPVAVVNQFHNAAQQLRLSTVQCPRPGEHVSLGKDSADLWLRATNLLAEERPQYPIESSPLATQSKDRLNVTDRTSQRLYRASIPSSTGAEDSQSVPDTPTKTSRTSINPLQARKREPRNFSRPSALRAKTQKAVADADHVELKVQRDTEELRSPSPQLQQCPPSDATSTTPVVTDSSAAKITQCDTINEASSGADRAVISAPLAHALHNETETVRCSLDSAVPEELGDKRLRLKRWQVWTIRTLFALFVFAVNIALGLAYLGAEKHPYLLAIVVFMKSKDILSTIINALGMIKETIAEKIWPPKPPTSKWILNLICAYAETEEQIMKTVTSLARGSTNPHKQAMCIILDGKPRKVLDKLSSIVVTTKFPYTTWRGQRGELQIYAGSLEGVPVILMEKLKNAGKKDSLILGHDLFNHPRDDMSKSTMLLRQEIWKNIIPKIITDGDLASFDYIFCTDADSTIHEDALKNLANALCRNANAFAACGVLFAEFGSARLEYSLWHSYQQFQYTFGQYVRRQAESMWGRVTCLPGCITMIAVRPEMGPAISLYAKPVTDYNLFRHQVQYLGTDRRLTWCMMSQDKHARTIFVPNALSETVVPSTLSHYLSQRRRWASNAYFNDLFYLCGPQQRIVTRIFAAADVVRLTLVFYRVFNTIWFIRGLLLNYYFVKILPTLIVTKTPVIWFVLLVLFKEPLLRKRAHKVFLGMLVNQIISPILSVIVFVNVLLNFGSANWGKTGVSTQGTVAKAVAEAPVEDATKAWTPKGLARTVRKAIRGQTPRIPKSSKVQEAVPAARNVGSSTHGLSQSSNLEPKDLEDSSSSTSAATSSVQRDPSLFLPKDDPSTPTRPQQEHTPIRASNSVQRRRTRAGRTAQPDLRCVPENTSSLHEL